MCSKPNLQYQAHLKLLIDTHWKQRYVGRSQCRISYSLKLGHNGNEKRQIFSIPSLEYHTSLNWRILRLHEQAGNVLYSQSSISCMFTMNDMKLLPANRYRDTNSGKLFMCRMCYMYTLKLKWCIPDWVRSAIHITMSNIKPSPLHGWDKDQTWAINTEYMQ